jgi:hypothetical protein
LENDTDVLFSEYIIEYIITTFNYYILPFEYVKLFSQIKTKNVFNIILTHLNLSNDDKIKIKNMIGPDKLAFYYF